MAMGQSKIVAQEDPEFTSYHRHTKSTATYGTIPTEQELKTIIAEHLLHNKG